MQNLIDNAQLKPMKSKSKYRNKVRYESGIILPNGEYLLMAFAKLDKDGLGRFFLMMNFSNVYRCSGKRLINIMGRMMYVYLY